MKLKKLKWLYRSWVLLLILTWVNTTSIYSNTSQNSVLIKGTITSSDGVSLPGVNVVEKGTNNGTVTDQEGNYSILVSSKASVLVFSYVGYLTEEIDVNDHSVVDVLLIENLVGLNEVVVIGYGTQKRSDITGSISSVSEEQLKAMPISSIDQALQGKAAGLIIQPTSGSPAGGVSVLVRGASSINASSQPLFIVDGIPLSNANTSERGTIDQGVGGQYSNPLASISPDDIESIEILKDASSAAIYGAKGANGVILITTKRGKKGKSSYSFSSYVGVQQLPHKLDVLNNLEYAKYRLVQYANQLNRNTYPVYETELDYKDNNIPFTTFSADSFLVNTDWQDAAYQNAMLQNYHLVATGGTQKTSYSISGGYYKVDGILVGSSYDRFSMKANTDTKLQDWFYMGNTLMVSYSKEDMSFNDAYYNGGMVERALQMRPDHPLRDSLGNYARPSADDELMPDNPIASELEKQDDNTTTRMVGNIYAQINLLKNLNVRSTFGTDISNGRSTYFDPQMEYGANKREKARMQEVIQQNMYWNFNHTLNYNKQISKHHLAVMAGWERSYVKWDAFGASRDDFPSNETRSLNLGSENNMGNYSYAGHKASESYYGRAIITLYDKLILTSTHRWDGTSLFSSLNRWGYFPSYALAFKVSDMNFMKNQHSVSFAKIRLSYGETGNDNVSSIPYLAQIAPVLTSFNNTVYPAYEPRGKDNPFVHWETVKTYNAGLDINFLDNRFQLNTDIYVKTSTEMLIEISLPATSSPFGSPWSNTAEMENTGFEFNLVSNNISGNFNWTTTATYSFNKNIINNMNETEINQNIRSQDPMITKTVEGYPVAQFYGHIMEGVFTSEEEIQQHAFQNRKTAVGDIKFKDINGDGWITDDDKTFIGNPIPTHVFGLSNELSYRGVDLSFFFQSMAGQKVFNMVRRRMEDMRGTYNQFVSVKDAFVPEDIYLITAEGRMLVAEKNTNTDIPRMSPADVNDNTRISDRYIEDASFIKLQSLTIGYTLSSKIAAKINAEKFRIYFTGKNLLTFTEYSGYDPEHGPLNNNLLLSGIDIGNYPIPRSFVFGVNLDY